MIDLGLLFLEKLLSQVLVTYNCIEKGSRNIYFFYLRKLSLLRGLFCSTALVIDTFYAKYCSDMIFLHPFFMQFYMTKNLSCLSISIMSNAQA